MRADLKTIFVADVEATCWETKEEQGTRPNEVIEIGISVLDGRTRDILECLSIPIKPRFTTVSPFCTQLTGWTQEALDVDGLDIVDALKVVRELGMDKDSVWFSCGEYDRVKLNAGNPHLAGSLGQLYGLKRWDSPFAMARTHINVKTIFALKHGQRYETELQGMLAKYGLTFEGRHHNGGDDAKNIARVVKCLFA